MNSEIEYDLLIVGGGINGVGIANDAAGRGLKVALCEMNDLGGATSSASSKLIHGGLRYLEQYEFRLVKEALAEREVLLRKAPHIIHPMRFHLPHRPHLRPRWMIRAGLYLYDFLSERVSLPRSRAVRFGSDSPLVPTLERGFEYSDAAVDDARLVLLNAVQARDLGARIMPRTRCTDIQEIPGGWRASFNAEGGESIAALTARAVVNATGPWVDIFANSALTHTATRAIRLVKGCHIVVPKLYANPEAFLLQNDDGRVVFVIPWQQEFTMIGTTEENFKGDPASASIAEWEIDYLLQVVNDCFRTKISRSDICYDFAGVRPLIDSDEENASRVSRDYTLELDTSKAPVLTIYGGKITTYRKLAEAAMEKLRTVFPHMKGDWTAGIPLPGGDFDTIEQLEKRLRQHAPWLPASIVARWCRLYGTRWVELLGGRMDIEGLGRDLGHGLYAREVDFLIKSEWARTADDILWRRTKLGLYFSQQQRAVLERYLEESMSQESRTAGENTTAAPDLPPGT